MSDFTIVRNDRLPSIACVFGGGSGRTLAAGTTVKFIMALKSTGVVKVSAAAVIEDATARRVRYDWTALNTDTAGDYVAEFEVTYTDGLVETFPQGRKLSVKVLADLG